MILTHYCGSRIFSLPSWSYTFPSNHSLSSLKSIYPVHSTSHPYCTSTGGSNPFDEALDRHIWSLSDQSLQWDGEIARKRREKPKEVERLVGELVQAREAVDEEEMEEYSRDIEQRSRKLAELDHPEDIEGAIVFYFVGCYELTKPWSFLDNAIFFVMMSQHPVSEELQDTARRTFAIVDELVQVRSYVVAHTCGHLIHNFDLLSHSLFSYSMLAPSGSNLSQRR